MADSLQSSSIAKKTYKIKWNDDYSQNDFLELCKALKESKAVIGNQDDIVLALSELFKINIKNRVNITNRINNVPTQRNNDSLTKFMFNK
ncbi:MAG: hypothetical protein HW421_568 [Ignavibacteria bacterium]|nr:hypothetical protein [Ignavibacteria bacterium]